MYLRSSIISTTYVIVIDWIIPTVRKHIVPQEALTGGGETVCIDKAAQGGVVVSGLQVIEARLVVVVLSLKRIQVKTR